jgi:hypothetical protein
MRLIQWNTNKRVQDPSMNLVKVCDAPALSTLAAVETHTGYKETCVA